MKLIILVLMAAAVYLFLGSVVASEMRMHGTLRGIESVSTRAADFWFNEK